MKTITNDLTLVPILPILPKSEKSHYTRVCTATSQKVVMHSRVVKNHSTGGIKIIPAKEYVNNTMSIIPERRGYNRDVKNAYIRHGYKFSEGRKGEIQAKINHPLPTLEEFYVLRRMEEDEIIYQTGKLVDNLVNSYAHGVCRKQIKQLTAKFAK